VELGAETVLTSVKITDKYSANLLSDERKFNLFRIFLKKKKNFKKWIWNTVRNFVQKRLSLIFFFTLRA